MTRFGTAGLSLHHHNGVEHGLCACPVNLTASMFPPHRETPDTADGPMAVSHDEQVNLQRRFSAPAASTDADVEATRSLLSLAASSNEATTQEETKMELNFASFPVQFNLRDANNNSGNAAMEDEASDQDDIWGLAMEYAAGVALRTRILDPALHALPNDISLSEVIRFLAMNCRGDLLFVTGSNGATQQASIQRVSKDDSAILTTWWNDDKFLSYTDEEWSEWWIRRCRFVDPGCEMYKLVTGKGETLGVVYFERNIVDHFEFGNGGRITLIRGMRIAPHLNPQVAQRKYLYTSDRKNCADEEMFHSVATLLFCHVLYMSVRYGSNAVGINCPKIPEAELFYQSLMGAPHCFDSTGRRYFRLESEGRWNALRESFLQQARIWLNQKSS